MSADIEPTVYVLTAEQSARLDTLIETTRPSEALIVALAEFTCGTCGDRVAMKTGPGRTYDRGRVAVPDDFEIPTCAGCGEEYLSVERAEVLEATS